MITTLELPDDLVQAVQSRASRDGWKLEETVADLLWKGLAATIAQMQPTSATVSQRITTDPATGLPLIICDPKAVAGTMTIEELLALEQA